MRYFLVILAALLVPACGVQKGNVKIFSVQPPQLVRKQTGEVLSYAQAKGYLCASPNDYEVIASCQSGGVKIYYVRPDLGGLYRKQANEVLKFTQAKGFLCVSPSDFQIVLEGCTPTTKAQGGAEENETR